jgi:hypothetical protein
MRLVKSGSARTLDTLREEKAIACILGKNAAANLIWPG